jgi:sugar phosphate isomerase/epimerase
LTGELGPRTLLVMRRLAAAADLGIIIHDEGCAGGKRLANIEADQYAKIVKEISGLCHVSIENSFNSGDITWFWERFVTPARANVSITLDIGHLELAGLDSVTFVRNMPQHLVERTAFVHMHHHDASEPHDVKDHRPLVAGCREMEALEELLNRKQDVRVILELDAAEDGMRRSIELLTGRGIRTSS